MSLTPSVKKLLTLFGSLLLENKSRGMTSLSTNERVLCVRVNSREDSPVVPEGVESLVAGLGALGGDG